MMTTDKLINAGVDVGKACLDICLHETGELKQFPNTESGVKRLIKWLNTGAVERLVVEATGRMERLLVEQASAAGLPIIVVQPLMVRRFAGAQGILAKTDELDQAWMWARPVWISVFTKPANSNNSPIPSQVLNA